MVDYLIMHFDSLYGNEELDKFFEEVFNSNNMNKDVKIIPVPEGMIKKVERL